MVDEVGVGCEVGDSLIMEKLSMMGAELKQGEHKSQRHSHSASFRMS